MTSKAEFIHQLRSSYPGLANEPLENLVSDNLISPYTVELPFHTLQQARDIIAAIFSLRERRSYQDFYAPLAALKNICDPGNKAIMMSYDFHVDSDQNLKLIEINTNASFQILGYEMYKMRQMALPVLDFSPLEIREEIQTELQLAGKSASDPLRIAIVDDQPAQQRLYVEFLAYNELFKSWGWDSRILDIRDAFMSFDPQFIYNRHTDFFLQEDDSLALKTKLLNRELCLSPHPFEYLLLADKQRLIDWNQAGFYESHGISQEEIDLLRKAVPLAYDLSTKTQDEVWALRKKLFFKPKNAFGSKQSYKGSSISHKTFQELVEQNTIAQEYVPAPEMAVTTPEGPQSYKYDLRCYAYQGRLQLIVARLYQGQVTNLRTPGGGFACVTFK